MNMGNNTQPQQQQPPPQQQQQQSNWPQHMNFQNPNDQLQSQQQNQHNKGFGNLNSDWTTLDPAIVSYRQFPTFLQGPPPQQQPQQQQQSQPQHNAADMFLPQLNQQNQGEFNIFHYYDM